MDFFSGLFYFIALWTNRVSWVCYQYHTFVWPCVWLDHELCWFFVIEKHHSSIGEILQGCNTAMITQPPSVLEGWIKLCQMLSWSSNWASVIHPFIGFIVGMMKSLSDECGWAHFVVWSSLWLVNGYPWVLVWVGKSLLTEKGEERAERRNRKIVEAGRHLRFDPRALAAKVTKM
jgi:hypothetical protein